MRRERSGILEKQTPNPTLIPLHLAGLKPGLA